MSSNNNNNNHFDYLVIGGGSGGLASARRAAGYGAKVAVVEKNKLGGTCVNVGCVPKKIMWNAASIQETLHEMHHYGFKPTSGKVEFDWGFIKESRDKYIEKLNGIYGRNLTNSGVTHIEGIASFAGKDEDTGIITINVNDEQDMSHIYTANHVLIATGGYPDFPQGEGILEHAISSDGFFELDSLPKRAAVVGAGYIAVELSGVLNALGTETYLCVRKEKAMRNFDDMISDILDVEMEKKQGVHILRNTLGAKQIFLDENGKKCIEFLNGDVVRDLDCVIMAVGRAPLVKPLNLEAVGMKQTKRGHIVVNEYSETNVQNVYALGDVCGKVELTPMAIAAGRRLADRKFGPEEYKDAKVSYENVPTVVFS